MKVLKLILLILTCLLFTACSRPVKAPEDTVNRLQDKVGGIASEYKALIYKERKLLVEINTLIDDMDKVIRKIDSHEIAYWNDEIENIDRRINDFNDKNNECVDKWEDLSHRTVAVKCKVAIGDLQEKIDEWNFLMKNEFNPQMNIYSDMVDTFYSMEEKLPEK